MFLAEYAKKHLINTKYGDALVNAVRIRTIDEKLYIPKNIHQYFLEKRNPSIDMLRTKAFFEANSDRVKSNIESLYDEESKECYEKAIEYRYTHDMSKRPRYTKNIYFVKGIIELMPNEVFVDGGAFVGDTLRKFKKITHDRFKKVICFEPDTYNYTMLKHMIDDKVVAFNMGLSDETGELSFFNNGSVGSKIIDNINEENQSHFALDKISTIRISKIDEIEDCKEATFIKMDIEGAELKALHGAKNTILRNKPKLAICLYHSDEDMLSIIEYVHELVPEYRLHVRQHSLFAAETVLYATI